MAGIELKADLRQAGVTLPNGTYLYTALVHSHRSAGHTSRNKTIAAFLGLKRVIQAPLLMGRNAGHISRTYFAGVVLPRDVLRRHTLFGYLHLARNEADAHEREELLIHGSKQKGYLIGSEGAKDLRWCKRCADDELECFGVANWKTIHQLESVRICHIHGDPLLVRCKGCGITPGSLRFFRLPGEACPGCNGSEFEEDSVVVRDAYQIFVQDVAAAFEKQDTAYRDAAWFNSVYEFIRNFPTKQDAERDLIAFLCRMWSVSSMDEIWKTLQVSPPSQGRLFVKAAQSINVRVLLHRAMLAIQQCGPQLREPRTYLVDDACSANSAYRSPFASVVRMHAKALGLGVDITHALASSSNVKAAAATAGLSYSQTFSAWKKVLRSMTGALGEDAVRKMLPKDRRVHKVQRIGRRQNQLEAYKLRVTAVLELNPGMSRGELWRQHYKAMRFLSRMDYGWLAKMVGGSNSRRRPATP